MLNARFRPLDHWPGEREKEPERAHFRAGYTDTLNKLEYELDKLQADEIVIQLDGLTRDWIRNDGWPKGQFWNLKGERCGVIVSFESPKGSISFPCDRYTDWKDNLRAIALSLEALRAVDRYGVTRGNEQYRGWTQIGNGNGKMDRASALKFLASLHSSPVENLARLSAEQLRSICRTAKIESCRWCPAKTLSG
jgi:hypothetical protein